jgi:hypothetical protein
VQLLVSTNRNLTGTRIETVPGPRDHSEDTPRLWGKETNQQLPTMSRWWAISMLVNPIRVQPEPRLHPSRCGTFQVVLLYSPASSPLQTDFPSVMQNENS